MNVIILVIKNTKNTQAAARKSFPLVLGQFSLTNSNVIDETNAGGHIHAAILYIIGAANISIADADVSQPRIYRSGNTQDLLLQQIYLEAELPAYILHYLALKGNSLTRGLDMKLPPCKRVPNIMRFSPVFWPQTLQILQYFWIHFAYKGVENGYQQL
ncbi:Hypothetical_protein [Hexamita inflata]|uniref:Hypothetical_protein n=1 Tax=Hexamita inflata TaxID=28002 RepID=A0ABP1GDS6_9EUKA